MQYNNLHILHNKLLKEILLQKIAKSLMSIAYGKGKDSYDSSF